ncbi:MAG: NAD(P)/FAD-dependent oxidoreductase [Bacillota bacterium]|nr:NAD(P)/FAD-dependent oxidoreductase [Bacillota bacterium]
MMEEIVIVGGGPGGIAAAISAKDNGKAVIILEGKDRIGKKLLMTGNGRCNLTNKYVSSDKYHSRSRELLESVIDTFGIKEITDFYSYIGIPVKEQDGGRMYPFSLQASSVLDILRLSLEERNIEVRTNCKVKRVIHKDNYFSIETSSGIIESKKVILCTGGNSYKSTGSDGSGYALAEGLGHSIIRPLPALTALILDYSRLKALSGIKINGAAKIETKDAAYDASGEILFTDYGVSGPAVFNLSRFASIELDKKREVKLEIDIVPEIEKTQFNEFLRNHFLIFSYRSISDALIGILNKKLIPILLKESKIDDIHKPCYLLSEEEIISIVNLIKGWSFNVLAAASLDMAQVTIGGVDTSEVNPKTLESKLQKSLYFAGELLDVDGDCGGYNIHFAVSSGYIAGKNAAI